MLRPFFENNQDMLRYYIFAEPIKRINLQLIRLYHNRKRELMQKLTNYDVTSLIVIAFLILKYYENCAIISS